MKAFKNSLKLLSINKMSNEKRKDFRNGILFITPWLMGFILLVLYPFFAALYYSFTRYNIIKEPRWVGFENYIELFNDPLFWTSLYNTFFYVGVLLPLATILSISIALLLNQKVRFMSAYRTIYFMPVMVPMVASSIVWMWILNPRFGLINGILNAVGIKGPGWLASPEWAKPALVLMSLWAMGRTIVIYLAGLQDIPKQLYEAARIDGASPLQATFHITIPMLSPIIFFNVVMGLISGFQYFTQAYIMTGGGPMNKTLFYSLYLYRNAFSNLKMGYASAQAYILFIIILFFTAIVFKFSNRWVHYG